MSCTILRLKGHRSKSHGSFQFFVHVGSVVPCLLERIASYVAQIQPMRSHCILHHFKVKVSKFKVAWVVHSFFAVYALWLHAFSTDSLYMKYNCNTWGCDVPCTIFRFTGQRSKSRGAIRFFKCRLTGSVPIWPICFKYDTDIPHQTIMCRAASPGQKVKGEGRTGC